MPYPALSARWMPRLVTPNNWRNRETTSQQCLTPCKRNLMEFLHRFVKMDPLVHTRYQVMIEIVDITRWIRSDEGVGCPICGKGDVHRFLEFTRCNYPLHGKRQYSHSALLFRIIGRFHCRIAENMTLFGGKKCSSTMAMHQLTPPPSPLPNWPNWAMNCAVPTTVFPRFGHYITD